MGEHLITPALSASAAEATAEALKAAKKAGCTVSYDLNYRKKLCTPAEAKRIQESMMSHVDVLITTEEDTNVVFGIKEKDYETVAEKLARTFKFKIVAITLREDLSVLRNNWTAIAYQDGKIYSDKKYDVEIVDRVGAGDSFTAGFLYGWVKEKDVEKGVRYGNAFAALKHTVPGDLNWSAETVPAATHAEPKPPPALAAGGGWAVQVGAFSAAETARKLVKDLGGAGYRAFVSPVSKGGKTLYRVRVGPEADKAGAEQIAQRLKARGLPETIVQND